MKKFIIKTDNLGIVPTIELKTLSLKVISSIIKKGIEDNELLNNIINKHHVKYPIDHLLYKLYNNYSDNPELQKFLLSNFREKVLYDDFDYYDTVIEIYNEYLNNQNNSLNMDDIIKMIKLLKREIIKLKQSLKECETNQKQSIIENDKKYDTTLLYKYRKCIIDNRKKELHNILEDLEEFINYPYYEGKYKEFSIYMQRLQNYIIKKLYDNTKYEYQMFIELYKEIENSSKWNILSDELKYQIKLLIINFARDKSVDVDIKKLEYKKNNI